MISPDTLARNNRIVATKKFQHRSWNGNSEVALRFYESGDIIVTWNPPRSLTLEQLGRLQKDIELATKDLKSHVKEMQKIAEESQNMVEEVATV